MRNHGDPALKNIPALKRPENASGKVGSTYSYVMIKKKAMKIFRFNCRVFISKTKTICCYCRAYTLFFQVARPH